MKNTIRVDLTQVPWNKKSLQIEFNVFKARSVITENSLSPLDPHTYRT